MAGYHEMFYIHVCLICIHYPVAYQESGFLGNYGGVINTVGRNFLYITPYQMIIFGKISSLAKYDFIKPKSRPRIGFYRK